MFVAVTRRKRQKTDYFAVLFGFVTDLHYLCIRFKFKHIL